VIRVEMIKHFSSCGVPSNCRLGCLHSHILVLYVHFFLLSLLTRNSGGVGTSQVLLLLPEQHTQHESAAAVSTSINLLSLRERTHSSSNSMRYHRTEDTSSLRAALSEESSSDFSYNLTISELEEIFEYRPKRKDLGE